MVEGARESSQLLAPSIEVVGPVLLDRRGRETAAELVGCWISRLVVDSKLRATGCDDVTTESAERGTGVEWPVVATEFGCVPDELL